MKWVSVKDRMPEEKQEVLIRYEKNFLIINAVRDSKGKDPYHKGFSVPGCLCEIVWTQKITHWTPLPELPKDDELTKEWPIGTICGNPPMAMTKDGWVNLEDDDEVRDK